MISRCLPILVDDGSRRYLFSQNLVALFITDPKVIGITETLLHIVLWSCIVFGYGSISSAVMRASGVVLVPQR